MQLNRLSVALSLAVLAALPVRAVTVPDMLATPAVAGSVALDEAAAPGWRALIADARLARLIELALANNRNLRVARLNIDAARAQYRISDAQRSPTLEAGAGSSASHAAGSTTRQLSVSLGVSAWELDLWGRLGSLKDAALASYLASDETQRSLQTSLVAELAQAWLSLAADQQLQALAEQTLANRQQYLQLTERRKQFGAASALDLATARAGVETTRGDLATARAQVAQDLNALRLLVGTEPPADALPAAQLEGTARLLAIPADLPSSVLLRRHDVRAAELSLQAARADVAAARAARFPTLSLTSTVGTASAGLGGLFSGGSGVWSFIPTLKLPIFDGGASRIAVEKAEVAENIQLAGYEKVIQTAFREAADALAERGSLLERLDAQQQLVAAYQTSLDLSLQRQQAGAESALGVLTAQRSLYGAQQSLIALRLLEQGNRLSLFKVLGGS